MGYYPAQIETAKELAKFLNAYLDIELETPVRHGAITDPQDFRGHIAHYHITKRKWDVAGFPFNYIIGKEEN